MGDQVGADVEGLLAGGAFHRLVGLAAEQIFPEHGDGLAGGVIDEGAAEVFGPAQGSVEGQEGTLKVDFPVQTRADGRVFAGALPVTR